MRTRIYLLILLLPATAYCLKAQDNEMDAFISDLMEKMTLEEKLGQLNLSSGIGDLPVVTEGGGMEEFIRHGLIGAAGGRRNQEIAVNESRLGIPLISGRDVIHGFSTIFPIPLAMACMWDMDLVEKSARMAASEASSSGICWTYSPMVDIARDPRWGRIAEGTGEDAWYGARMAEAFVRGYQGDDLKKNNTIMACVKHFALYGAAEAGRDYNTVDMSRLSMYNDYLPPYKAAVEAGAGSVMSSFNVIDWVPASGNKWLLTDLLRGEWGFDGFVVSDYTAINEMIQHGMGDLQAVAVLALKAGLDMDMQGKAYIGTLSRSLEEGKVGMEEIDRACRRVLEAKYKLGLFDDPFQYFDEARAENILSEENLQFARETAAKSVVLLKNSGQLLPLKRSGTIAVIGPLADSKSDMLGTWAFPNNTDKVVSVAEGIRIAGGEDVTVLYARGSDFTDDPYLQKNMRSGFVFFQNVPVEENAAPGELLKEAVETAGKADVIVAALGEPASWSGEAASRSDIGLPACQQELLKALLETGKPVVLVLLNGRPLTLTWEDENVNAILEAWHGGTMAGNGIADVLFGDYNPSGKLTVTFPRSVGQIPLYYNHKNTGRPMDPDNKFTSKYLDIPNEPLYPFGYGISYTTYKYGDIRLDKTELAGDQILTASITVTNTGEYTGEEVVQLYITDPVASVSRAVKELKNYRKILLRPGEEKEVSFTVTTEDLKFYNGDQEYVWEPGEFVIRIGTNSEELKSASVRWNK